MGFVIRLLVVFGKFAITIIVIALVLYATIFLINRLVQFLAEQLGYEVGDFFKWFRSKLPEITFKKRKEKDGENT